MSIKLLNELKYRTAGSASLRAVLRSLCEFSNEATGKCNPSLSTLLQDTELSKPTLLNCLSILEATGAVERISGNAFQSSSYFVNLEKLPLNKTGKLRDSVKNSETIKNIETDLLQNENDEEGRLNILPSEEILPRSNIDTTVGKEFNQGLVKNLTKGREKFCTRVGKNFDHKTLIETKEETEIETNNKTYKNDVSFSEQVDDELPILPLTEVVETAPAPSKPKTEKKPRSAGKATKSKDDVIKPDDVREALWNDFSKQLNARGKPITYSFIGLLRKQAKNAGWTLEEIIEEIVLRGSTYVKAEWLTPKDRTAVWVKAEDYLPELPPVKYATTARDRFDQIMAKSTYAYDIKDLSQLERVVKKEGK